MRNILVAEGRINVRTNVMLRDRNGNLSEVDVACGFSSPPWSWVVPTRTMYIECKEYAASNPVSLDAVAKFKEVLILNNIPAHRGLVVTTSRFSPRATTIGVPTMNGEQLKVWEKAALASKSRRKGAAACILFALSAVSAAEIYVRSQK